jgi:transcriptional regulator with XRE-family HTH domain
LLVEAREQAGLSQAEVAQKLKRAQSFVSKYELGDRRLDVVDFMLVCDSIGVNPVDVLRQVWVAARRKRSALRRSVA